MADMIAPAGLMEHFAELEDPRTRGSRHGLLELLLTAIGAALSGWPGVRTVIRMECERTSAGVTCHERRYYLCSRLGTAAYLGEVVRGHWGIENKRHWPLNVVFGEDQARMRMGDAAIKLLGFTLPCPKPVPSGQNQQGLHQAPTVSCRQR